MTPVEEEPHHGILWLTSAGPNPLPEARCAEGVRAWVADDGLAAVTVEGAVDDLDALLHGLRSAAPHAVGGHLGALVARTGVAPRADSHWLFAVTSVVSATEHSEYEQWFDTEHIPALLEIPGWHDTRRFELRWSADDATHLVLHRIAGPGVLEHPLRARAAATPWAMSMAEREWFLHTRRAILAPRNWVEPVRRPALYQPDSPTDPQEVSP